MNGELLRFNKKQKYLIFDTETEHLNLISSRPWQVAWIVAQNDKIIEKHDVYIYWKNLNISEGAAKVTGFTNQEYLKKAIPNNEAWEKFSSYLYDEQYKIVGHNLLGFDVYMINSWRKHRKMPSDYSFIDRIIDTNSLAKAIEKNMQIDKNNFLAWQYKLINFRERGLKTSQSALLKKYNIPHDPKLLHDALYDIEMNYEIFRKQIYDIEL